MSTLTHEPVLFERNVAADFVLRFFARTKNTMSTPGAALWLKDVAAAAALVFFIVCSFALSDATVTILAGH